MSQTKIATRQLESLGGTGSPGGDDKNIQFNDNGVFNGATNISSESGNLFLKQTTDPTPVDGGVVFYSKNIAGRNMPKWMPPSGIDNPIQSGLFFNNVSLIGPGGGNAVSLIGCTVTNVGTISHPTLSTTSIKSQTRRFLNTSAANAGSLCSTRITVLECWRGDSPNTGGFFVVCRFSLNTLQTGCRGFFGLSSRATTAPTNVDPFVSITDSKIGLALNNDTGNWTFIHNSAGITPTQINLGTDFPINNTNMMELIIFAKPNDTIISYRVKNLQTNAEVSGSISNNLPPNNVFLGRIMWLTNNTTASSVSWDCSRFGLETDF